MKFVQTSIWFVVTLITIVLEISVRTVIFFPIGLVLTILLTFLGAKHWLRKNRFLDYCCPWKLGSKNLPISSSVSKWLDPDF